MLVILQWSPEKQMIILLAYEDPNSENHSLQSTNWFSSKEIETVEIIQFSMETEDIILLVHKDKNIRKEGREGKEGLLFSDLGMFGW